MNEYKKRLVEVYQVLKHLSEENYHKIPSELIESIKENMDKDYSWNFDETKKMQDQKLCRDTIAILSYINMKYLLNKKQKEYLKEIHKKNEIRTKKHIKYKSDNMFNNIKSNKEYIENNNILLTNYEKDSLLKKFFNNILKFFK